MSKQQTSKLPIQVTVENIGGINKAEVEFLKPVSILSGRNATNRTSLLRAIMAVLGSNNVTLKGDADEGSVEMKFNERAYSRTLYRQQGSIVYDGEPYLDDPKFADLFAFLLGSNDARLSVERVDDLYDIIMSPVDTEQIDAEIDRFETEGTELQSKLDELNQLERRLPQLEEERTELQGDIESKDGELDNKRTELDTLVRDAGEATDIDDRFEELRDTRKEFDDVHKDIEDEERILGALREDQSDIEEKLEGLTEINEGELIKLKAEIEKSRQTIENLELTVDELESVIKFNESLVEESQPEILEVLKSKNKKENDSNVTDKLLKDYEDIVCWTCGSQIQSGQVEETVSVLQEVYGEKINQRSSLRDEIAELEAEQKHIERTEHERRQLSRKLESIEEDLNQRTDRVERLRTEAEELADEVNEFEEQMEKLETDDHHEQLALHREVNELEFEIDQIEAQLDEIDDEINEIERRLAQRDEIGDKLEEVGKEIENLRSLIERLETESVEEFNEQMETILDLLGFENIERIWIERVETEVQEGRRKIPKTIFDLHVIRSTESGSVYEDTVEHLSESERELVGLVFALAGYLVHRVYEQVPFMLLDSIEAFDSGRLSTLVNYLAEYAEFLVVALLPEDAAALDDDYQRITDV